MKNNVLFLRNNFKSNEEYKRFIDTTIETNINKMNIPQMVLIVLNCLLLYVDIFIYKCFKTGNEVYLNLFYAHIVMIISSFVWIIFYYKVKHKLATLYKGIIFYIFCGIALYWCAFMNISMFETNRQVAAYIVGSFTIVAIFNIIPILTIIMQVVSFTVMMISLALISNNNIGMYNIINLIFTLIFSIAVSITVFNYHLKNYMSKIKLIQNNEELKNLYSERNNFFTNISHELRTPLNVLYSAQEMIKLTLDQDDYHNSKLMKYLELMKQNTDRLNKFTSNIIDLTKLDVNNYSLNMSNINIVKLIEDITLESVIYTEKKGISITFDTNVEELIVSCDSEAIERIMLNLLSNSVKFTNNGGNIFVSVKKVDSDVYIVVKDDGEGISKSVIKNIFDRFVQQDKSISRKTEGSGIGLSIVDGLVKLHKGDIEVYSEENVGSTFIIRIPIVNLECNIKEKLIERKNIEKINIEFSDIYFE